MNYQAMFEQTEKKLSDKELSEVQQLNNQIFVLFSSQIDWNNPHVYHNLGEKANKALDDLEDNYRIKLLGLIRRQIQSLHFIFKLHFVFLEWSIKLKNYKAAKQFIENNSIVNQFILSKSDQKENRIEKYFYYCGIIYAAYWDYPEALRYFELASKSDKGHYMKGEIDKQINIIKCRTGQAYNLDDYSKDEDIHLINQQNEIPERDNLKIICKKKEIYTKLPLSQPNGDRWGVKNLEFLTNKLNIFWINEENEYIQFKKVDKSYDELNDSLMKRYKLISNMIIK